MNLDDLRALKPDYGFALYAFEPNAPVVLEVHYAGEVFTFSGPTEAAAIAKAFPPASPPAPQPQAPEVNIFD
jgi:hypothetical protein